MQSFVLVSKSVRASTGHPVVSIELWNWTPVDDGDVIIQTIKAWCETSESLGLLRLLSGVEKVEGDGNGEDEGVIRRAVYRDSEQRAGYARAMFNVLQSCPSRAFSERKRHGEGSSGNGGNERNDPRWR